MDDDDEQESCTKRKCKPEKNPCGICLRSCKPKNAMRCSGACRGWIHFKCANLTKGKIKDIKDGTVEITCPCPDCKSILPKEVLRDCDTVYTCNNVKCPANNPPACDAENCQANVLSRRKPQRCPPPGTLRKCEDGACRVFSRPAKDITYNYDEHCDRKCTYKQSKKSCYSPPPSQSGTSLNRLTSDHYSCAESPMSPCCEADALPDLAERFCKINKASDRKLEYQSLKQCRHQPKDQDYHERCEDEMCKPENRRAIKRRREKPAERSCCGTPSEDDDDYYQDEEYSMADEMMDMCKTVVDLERRIECMLGKLMRVQQPNSRNTRWQVNIATVSRGTGGLPDLNKQNTLLQICEKDKRELSYYLREMYKPLYKKLLIIASVMMAKMQTRKD